MQNSLSNAILEQNISQLTGMEERRRVEHALFMSAQRDRRRREAIDRRDANAASKERDRCVKICEAYPDNLMARHLAELIRGGK